MARTLKAGITNLHTLIGVDEGAMKVWKASGLDAYDGTDTQRTDITSSVVLTKDAGASFGTGTYNGVSVPVLSCTASAGARFGTGTNEKPTLKGVSTIVFFTTSCIWRSGYSAAYGSGDSLLMAGNATKPGISVRGQSVEAAAGTADGTAMMIAVTLDNDLQSMKLYYCVDGGTINTPTTTPEVNTTVYP